MGRKNETYDDVINRLLEFYRKNGGDLKTGRRA